MTNYKRIQIPVPPIDVQKQIVEETEEAERQIFEIENRIYKLKEQLNNPDYFSYSTIKLEKISVMIQRGKAAKYGNSNIQIIKSGQARGYLDFGKSCSKIYPVLEPENLFAG